MGFEADEATLQSVSGSLRAAAEQLASGGATPPGGVRAGALTGVFTAMAANLAKETETYTGQLSGAGEAVVSSRDSYLTVDEHTKQEMRPREERPAPPEPSRTDYDPRRDGPV